MEFAPIFTIATKEFHDRMRNRWVLAVALVFTVFSLVIAYFGGAQQGTVGFRSIEFTIASLVSLVIYLIPLIALLLGFDAIVGERERGSLDLLLALPITRLELLLGKYLGLAAALTVSTVVGFGLVAVLLFKHMSGAGLYHYAGFMLSSVLLGLAFLSLAVLLSVLARDRTRATGLAIATWFFFVLVFDLLVLGLAALAALSAVGGLTGCGDQAAETQSLAPVEIDRATSCELDGMLLADYPGPKAQVHFAGQAQPSFFCDTVELFNTLLAGEQVRAVRAVYVQDMGATDWDKPQGHWIDAKTALYVLGSKRHGSMGPTIASFAKEADASRFATEYGGKVLRFTDIKADMVDLSGGALHDTRM